MKWIVSKTPKNNNLETINEAITKASDYDEIHICSGHYKEKLIINLHMRRQVLVKKKLIILVINSLKVLKKVNRTQAN